MMQDPDDQTRQDIIEPTLEQARDGAFALIDIVDKRRGGKSITIGTAYRRTPMIDRLYGDGLFTREEHKALAQYRHYASIAERSPQRDSLARDMPSGGGGEEPMHHYLNAVAMVGWIEAAAGTLRGILRAVAVDDRSLSQWAIDVAGSQEKRKRYGDGWRTTIEPKPRAFAIAKMEMKMAAQRVHAELEA